MKNPLPIMFSAAKTIFASRKYKLSFAVIATVFVLAYIFFPVLHMSGKSVSAQLSSLSFYDYLLFAALSVAVSLLVSAQIFLFFRSKKGRIAALGQGGVGAFSAFFSAILATAVCFSCVAAVLGFLGAGSVFFITEHKIPIITGVIVFILISLYFSALRIEGLCEKCDPKNAFKKSDR